MDKVERSLTFACYSLGTVQMEQERAREPNRGGMGKGTEPGMRGSQKFIKRKTQVRLEMF